MESSYGMSPFNDPEAVPIGLSIFHTAFNIVNALLLIGFVGFIAKMVTKMVPSKGDDEEFHLEYIGTGMMDTAELSLGEAAKEIAKFGEITSRMNGFLRELIKVDKSKKQKKYLSKIRKYEEITDSIENEVVSYLMQVSQGQLSAESKERIAGLLSISNDLERIGDIIYQMSRDFGRMIEDDVAFNNKQLEGVYEILDSLDEAFVVMNKNLQADPDRVTIAEAYAKESVINATKKRLYKKHLKRMEDNEYDVKSGSVYKDFFYSCEKVGDHIINVSEAITGEKEKEFALLDD